MSKIFISGSRIINDYEIVATHLLNVVSEDDIVLVGDCEGVDTLVQKYCDSHDISFIVYYVGTKPRNAVGTSPKLKKCFGFNQKAKDIQMSIDCEYGFAIWDGKSKGTKSNIIRLREMSKKCEVVTL